MGQPRPLFVYFRSFQQQFYRKIVDHSGIRTRIVGVEGEHADHLTTTTALPNYIFVCGRSPKTLELLEFLLFLLLRSDYVDYDILPVGLQTIGKFSNFCIDALLPHCLFVADCG